jgi:hypothetical protein
MAALAGIARCKGQSYRPRQCTNMSTMNVLGCKFDGGCTREQARSTPRSIAATRRMGQKHSPELFEILVHACMPSLLDKKVIRRVTFLVECCKGEYACSLQTL